MTPQEALAAALQSLDNGERDVPDADALGFAAAILPALSAAGYSIVSTEELEGLRRELDTEMAGTEDWAEFYYVEIPIPLARRLRAALEGAKP